MKFVIALTALNLVVSGTTLAIVVVGGKRAHSKIAAVEAKSKKSFSKLRAAFDALDD